MDRYEISLWEDFPNTTSGGQPFLDERKLAVIGSDTMKSPARAIEPKLVNNINGTNTFTFKMYQNYIDEFTGEQYINPFLDLLINERKVKVLWKEKWYDLIIKDISEESATKAITYTCKDAFITELSRNGYNLEYSTDLQNNIGTAGELVNSVLENSGWEYDEENSTHLYQTVEDAVYETTFQGSYYLQVGYQIPGEEENEGFQLVDVGARIFIFYSSLIDINNTEPQRHKIRFLSFPYNQSINVDPDTRVIINEGNCIQTFYVYKLSGVIYISNSNTVGQNILFTVDTRNGVSTEYRGKYYINNQRTAYDKLFDRYVDVYNDSQNNNKLVYGYSSTEFSDPIMVVNLVANPTDFTNTDGWVGDNLMWGVYPKFKNQTVTTYSGASYLKMGPSSDHYVFNKGISSNKQYLYPSSGDIKKGDTGGFHIGDKYVFKFSACVNQITIKPGESAVESPLDLQGKEHFVLDDSIQPFIGEYDIVNNKYIPKGSNYFDIEDWSIIDPSFYDLEHKSYLLTCKKTCSAEELDKLGLFINIGSYSYWFKEIQFFKYEIGEDNNGNSMMIEPGQVAVQSIAKTIYKYYNADYSSPSDSTKIATIPEELEFLYQGEEKQSRFVPKSTKCEKIATINESGSNRFNILQSIAEAFQCWVRFNVQHDETGAIEKDSETGLPIKKVAIVETVGEDLGWSFEYGIDLKTIKRTIASNDLTTKVLVLPNDNEYGKNGFCTIARSNLNYIKENFVLDFGYFTGQGLLDTQMVNRDLYDTTGNYLGYYYKLHNWNTEYDAISKFLPYKKTELTKQESQLEVLKAQQYATNEQLGNCWSDLMNLACVDNQADAQSYAETHSDHVKVQSLMNNIAQLKNKQSKFNSQVSNLENSIQQLKIYIDTNEATQKQLLDNIEELHINFFKKYARYIQEGTWQDSECIDDDKYYLDAVNVAYTSSRPRLQYDINVMRLQALDDFSSKVFDVGDLCYIVDREFFGYNKDDETTPYKLQIVISEITSNFDNPEKDTIKVQNFKTQFDDLFQRITATTQSLQYASGGYAKAAAAINPDKTLSFGLLQDTFDYNENWVLNANNQQVTWDSTGITVSDNSDAAMKVRIIAGGIFVSNDGGNTWKNAVRGDGISTDILTAGRINTSEIYLYDGGHPAFRWDSAGIDAYYFNNAGTAFDKFVRFDQFGIYGYKGTEDFRPATEEEIWYKEEGIPNDEVRFGLTWKGFFLHGESGISGLEIKSEEDSNGDSQIRFIMTSSTETKDPSDNQHYNMPVSLEISTDNDIVLKTKSYYNKVTRKYEDVDRIQIGRLKDGNKLDYGIWVRDKDGNSVFNVSADGVDTIGGWNLTQDSFYHSDIQNINTLGLYSRGKEATIQEQLDDYYILAGSKFGVTLDGRIYSSGGKIGGWNINDISLYHEASDSYESITDGTSQNGYVQPKSYGKQFNIQAINNINYCVCDISEYRNEILYITVSRSYNKINYPTVAIITDSGTNGKLLWNYNNTTNSTIEYSFTVPPNATFLYINTDDNNNLSIKKITYKDNGDIDSEVSLSKSFTNNKYIGTTDLTQKGIEVISSFSNGHYMEYDISNYQNKLLYISSNRNYTLNSYPILSIITNNNGEVVSITESDESSVSKMAISVPKDANKLYLNYTTGVDLGHYTGNSVVINSDGSITCSTDNGTLWKIDDLGNAYFEMINAVGGYIAGWHIDTDKIWNGNGTTLSAGGNATYNTNRYTIVTNNIAASGGNIGGWDLSPSGFSGGSMALSSDGIIYLGNGGSKIFTYSTDTVGISPHLHVTGSITSNGMINAGSHSLAGNKLLLYKSEGSEDIDATDLSHFKTVYSDFEVIQYTFIDEDTSTTTTLTRKGYLDWLQSNWGKVTPNEEWVAGINTVGVTSVSGTAHYNEGGYYSWLDENTMTREAFFDLVIGMAGIDKNEDAVVLPNYTGQTQINVTGIYNEGKAYGEALHANDWQNGYNTCWNSLWVDSQWASSTRKDYYVKNSSNWSMYVVSVYYDE